MAWANPGRVRVEQDFGQAVALSQILDLHGRMVGIKWQSLMAPATPGMFVTDTSVLNSSVFRK